jgi:hypothetical protein
VLVDDPVAGLAAGEAADAEGRDPEMLPHRPYGAPSPWISSIASNRVTE